MKPTLYSPPYSFQGRQIEIHTLDLFLNTSLQKGQSTLLDRCFPEIPEKETQARTCQGHRVLTFLKTTPLIISSVSFTLYAPTADDTSTH
jgi:hypothetical protein